MDVTITSHYAETIPGVVNNEQVIGGYFYPGEGEGVVEATLSVEPTGEPGVLAEWVGTSAKVTVLERAAGNGTRVVPVVWIEASDLNGTAHTREYPLAPGVVDFGFVVVSIA